MEIRRRRKALPATAAAVSLALVLSGCGGSSAGGGGLFSGMFEESSTTTTELQPVSSPAAPGPGRTGGGTLQHCPVVEVNSAESTIEVHAGPAEPSNLRYQVTINDLARECWRNGGTAGVKLGVAGRVVLGPKGGPGSYTVPVRIIVLRGGDEEVYDNVVRVPVAIRGGQGSAGFTHVVPNLGFQTAGPGDRLTGYLIRVGFANRRR